MHCTTEVVLFNLNKWSRRGRRQWRHQCHILVSMVVVNLSDVRDVRCVSVTLLVACGVHSGHRCRHHSLPAHLGIIATHLAVDSLAKPRHPLI